MENCKKIVFIPFLTYNQQCIIILKVTIFIVALTSSVSFEFSSTNDTDNYIKNNFYIINKKFIDYTLKFSNTFQNQV